MAYCIHGNEETKMALPNEIQKNNWVIFHKDGRQKTMEEGKKHFKNGSLTKKKNNRNV